MNRRDFLGCAPLLLATPALAALEPEAKRPQSRAAQSGFLPNVPLITHEGKGVHFYDDCVAGKIVMINFFLVRCSEGVCPRATANIRQVQDLLGERMGRDVFFYSVTLQPETDSPDLLKGYAQAFDVKPGWTFLTGRRSDIDHLRKTLGYFDPDPQRDKDPSNHSGMGRYIDDRLDRWGAVALSSSPKNIASTFKWLSS